MGYSTPIQQIPAASKNSDLIQIYTRGYKILKRNSFQVFFAKYFEKITI
jgi:hypothetical protein